MARVLFLTYHLPTPDQPGAGRPWGEAEMLRDLGHEVTVVTAGTHYLTGKSIRRRGFSPWAIGERAGIRIVSTWAPSGQRKSLSRRMLNYLVYSGLAMAYGLRSTTDVVFVGTDPTTIASIAYPVARRHRARLVLDERDLFPETAVVLGMLKPGTIADWIEAAMRFLRARADHIVAATPGIKRALVDKGLDPGKISVIVNAFSPAASPLLRTATQPEGDYLDVLFTGSMGLAADIPTVLRAAEICHLRGLPVRFRFLGDGDRRSEYMRYCEEHEIENCSFPAPVPREELEDYLVQASVCLHALPPDPFWRCALPSKIFDYMAFGKPVVFAGEGDVVDLLSASGGGIAVPPGDPDAIVAALETLHRNPEMRSRMASRGRAYVEQHFTRESQLEVLRGLFGSSSG